MVDLDRVKKIRRACGYSLNKAAVEADVSLVSWRMFEANEGSVSEPIQAKCRRAVAVMERKASERVA